MTAGAVPGLLLAGVLLSPCTAAAEQYFIYIGTHTAEPSSGAPPRVILGRPARLSTSRSIYAWRFDPATTSLSPFGLVAEMASPGHVWISPDGKYLYAMNWQENSAPVPPGVDAYAIVSKTAHHHVSNFKGAVMQAHFAPRAEGIRLYENAGIASRWAIATDSRGEE